MTITDWEPHRAAANAEGWDIWDCNDSAHRWQVQKFDDLYACDANIPTLDSDQLAWKIVAKGTEPHHIAAREFLRVNCLPEYQMMMRELT